MTDFDLKTLARRNRNNPSQAIVPRRHLLSRYVLPGVLVIGFLALVLWSTRNAYLPSKRVAVIPVHLSLAEVRTEGTPLFKAAGWVEPRPTPIRVAALASGVVEQLLVVEDQEVDTGQPIAQLVSIDAQLALQQADSTLQLRIAEVGEAKANLVAAETNLEIPAHLELIVAEAEAAVAAIETELTNLPQKLEAAEARRRLAEIDKIARQRARDALSAVEVAAANSALDAASAEVLELTNRSPALTQQLDALRRRHAAAATRLELKTDEKQALSMSRSRLAAATARQAEAKTMVDQAQLRLQRMTITAPVSGRVLQLMTSPGSQLNIGPTQMEKRDANTVVTMYQPERLQVRVDVRFEDLPRVTLGQPTLVESPALLKPLEGRVLFLTGFANIQKNTLEVKVSIEAPPSVIKPEMLVDVTFLAAARDTALTERPSDEFRLYVPKSVVHADESGSFVWVADLQRGLAKRQAVRMGGEETAGLVEILDGLNESSRVISSAADQLHDGDRIHIYQEPVAEGQSMSFRVIRRGQAQILGVARTLVGTLFMPKH